MDKYSLQIMSCRRRRSSSFTLVAMLFCLFFVSCKSDKADNSASASTASDARPQRIVSLSPSVTEILYGVGAFERVVAVSDYCEYPKEVARLPRVGGWNNPHLEQIVGLRPDLVVFAEAQAPFIKDKVEALGIKTLSVPSNTIADALAAIEQTGRAVGNEAEAQRLAAETRERLDAVRARTRDLPRRRVLVVVDRIPGTLRDIYTATRGSFISQVVEAAGGESIAPAAQTGWGKMQKEAIVALDPEIIIDLMMQPSESGAAEDATLVWGELKQVKAVREGRVYTLRDAKLIHPSQFVADSARKIAELIHADAFASK